MNEPFLSLPIAKGIPEKRARFLFRVRSEKSHPDDEQLAATQSHGVLSQKRYMEMTGNKVVAALAGTDNFNHVEQDDFVISLRTFEGGIERATESGCISPAYTVLAPLRGVEPGFFHYLLKSKVFISHLQTTVTGIRDGKSVKFENFANIVLPHPGLETQRRIADFLDRETARIDLLIEKKQRLVALLGDRYERHRENLLLVENQDSQKRSMRWLIRVGSGNFLSNEEMSAEQSSDRPVPVVGGNGTMAYTAKSNSKANTLVVGRVGALCGNVHFFEEPSWVTDNALIVRLTSKDILPRYAFELLKSAKLNDKANKSAQPLITGETVKKVRIELPEHEEQQRRIDRLNQLSRRFAKTTRSILISIDRLKEYRSALITAAVTGQIDVASHRSGATQRRLDALQEEMDA
ncbi:restriction endonuclease subunit S [Aliiroseovarius crassostreae]|uniref:Restriction endonuclease subunit S n=1 Tax=Aliiroseovarius crassostreae TaxID=154981 RepID=A0A9Q9LW30_9RHOB|nr:restriction endonuclease subunit S [Aliiroseovarius crassostreae]UWP96511.1 restriction endonuclease subunit S [Aliiroseovarius crassostreae]